MTLSRDLGSRRGEAEAWWGLGRLAVTVQQVVRDKAGTIIADGTVTHVYRFVDGLVTEMEILE